ncbi:hypothetical protein ACFYPZ_35790 [Streptomyces sp. NPDC005506]|uniref:hypothetical protein n=1 Tax=unclassified Streptomyces TaxID=2593676 RepID=UPI00368A3DB9
MQRRPLVRVVLRLSAKFAPVPLTKALKQVPFRNGDGTIGTEVYVQPDKLRQVFAENLPTSQTALMAVTQRPIALSAFADKLTGAAWRNKPVDALVGRQDRSINPTLELSEAKRAHARKTVKINFSHVSLVPHPQDVKNLIVNAAEDYMRTTCGSRAAVRTGARPRRRELRGGAGS